MDISKPEQRLKVLKYISDSIQRNERIAELLEVTEGRVSQIIRELRDDDLVMVENDTYKLTRNGYKIIHEKLYNNSIELSEPDDRTELEDVVVYFLVKPIKDRSKKGWRDKVAEIKNNDYRKIREDPDEYIRVQEYNQVLLKPDAIQINLGKIYADNLLAAKDEALQRATKILDKIEKQGEESLHTSQGRFDGFLTYQSIKEIEDPPSFYFGEEPATTPEILEKSEKGARYHITANEEDDSFRISLPMSEPLRREYIRLKEDMRAQPERYVRLPDRVEEIEKQLERMEGR